MDIDESIKELLFTIEVKLPDRKPLKQDVTPLVAIHYDSLEKQLETTPEFFCFWGMLHAEQKAVVNTIELAVRKRKAKLAESLLRKAREEGLTGSAIRRSDINDFADGDAQLTSLQVKLLKESKTLSKLEVVLKTIQMKSEHLRSLSGFKKQELREGR